MKWVFCKNGYVGCCREMRHERVILGVLQINKRERERERERVLVKWKKDGGVFLLGLGLSKILELSKNDYKSVKTYIYLNENKINKKNLVFLKIFIMVLFRIYLIGKMIFTFLKVIHGHFKNFSKY